MKREAPYNRLKRISAQWIADKVLYRHRKQMWTLDTKNKTYSITELSDKLETANSLGYTIELSLNNNNHVVFTYVKKLPEDLPWQLRY